MIIFILIRSLGAALQMHCKKYSNNLKKYKKNVLRIVKRPIWNDRLHRCKFFLFGYTTDFSIEKLLDRIKEEKKSQLQK